MYHEAAKISGERFCVFYPFRNRFFLNPWVQLEFYKNCGSRIHIKNTFCKKIGSKRPFQPSAVVRAIYIDSDSTESTDSDSTESTSGLFLL